MGIFTKGISKNAYQGELTCPYSYYIDGEVRDSRSKAIRFVEEITPTRLRYRCRKCGGAFQYDISNRRDLNPYAAYSERGKLRRYLRKLLQGRKLKGGVE